MLPIDSARIVANWTGLGGNKLPSDFVNAIELFERVYYIEVGHEPRFDFESLTVDNAENVIHDLAQQIALARSGDGHGPLGKAKQKVLDIAARQVLNKANAAVPILVEKLTPSLEKQADAYAAAVALLPDDISAEKLFQSGAGAVAAYQTAQSVVAGLDQLSSWVASTGHVPGYSGKVDPVLRILRPTNAVELSRLDDAHHKGNIDRTLSAINPVFFAAAKNGIEFAINTPNECDKLRRELTTINPSKIRF